MHHLLARTPCLHISLCPTPRSVAYISSRRASLAPSRAMASSQSAPQDVVQRQVELYNARSVEPFMSLFPEDVFVFDTVTGNVLARNKEELRPRYVSRFQTPVNAEVIGRLVLGNVVVDREFITGLPGDAMADCLATYVVDGQKLKRISFVWRPRDGSTKTDQDAIDIADAQLEQYNAHSVDGFMALIHDDVQVFDGVTGALIAGSAAELRPRYETRFKGPVHCELLGRLACGNTVVDREIITGLPDGGVSECLATYVVEGRKIKRIYFVGRPRTPGTKL